ncbi:hypothetical protein HYH02_009987 [Chlamydomonas schloesseri]|uniref:Uncharacterized protein n=1 Tax=Chlamydomonas schloesseri TaxID=2026947 RepID=A0A835TA35_9CHLO|nr:hypothetical protein HYH02_009987 [Chlamydomonas schloesseri]|eukprot:KAG2441398.1 hypothetical protein HYH02_009987 [Chlamydomonas schloesseri]
MEPGASMPSNSGAAQECQLEGPKVPTAVPGTPLTATTAKPGPPASVEEAVSFAALATFLYRVKALSLLAAAWPVLYKACVQPVGHSVRAVKAGAVEVAGRLSELASVAAMALAAGAETATAGLNSATSFLAGTKTAAKTATSAASSSSTISNPTSSTTSTATTAAPAAVYDVAAVNRCLRHTAVARNAVLPESWRQVQSLTHTCTRIGQPFVFVLMYANGYTDKPAAMDAAVEQAAASGSLVIAVCMAPGFTQCAAAAADLMGSPAGWEASAAEIERRFGLDVALASRLPGARNRGVFGPVIGLPAFTFGGAHLSTGLLPARTLPAGCELPLSDCVTLRYACDNVFIPMKRWKEAAEARAAAVAPELLAAQFN